MEDASGGSTVSLIWQLLFLAILLVLSGIFSGSETALLSVGKLKLLSKSKEKSGENGKNQVHTVNRLLTATLIMNNFVNLLISSVATLVFLRVFQGWDEQVVAILGTLLVTLLVLVFGEITPKIYAREYPERVFDRTSPLLRGSATILAPAVKALMAMSNLVVKIFGGEAMKETPFVTTEDIVSAIDVGKEEGMIDYQESLIVKRTLEMGETDVKEIMTPRVDVVAIEENSSLKQLTKLVDEEGYSRIPVYREEIDNIIGVCYTKDVVGFIENNDVDSLTAVKVRELMREPLYVPETMKVTTLLKIFKEKKVHIAIVVDEFGGTAGIVTLEDILEEILGEIMDEYDEDEVIGIRKTGENTYVIDAAVPINDIERELNLEFPETEHETLGGYLLELFQRIPSVGEEIEMGDYRFRIIAAMKNKIERVLMTIKRGDHFDK